MSRIPQMIYFEENSFLELINYKKQNNLRNNSQAINQLIGEFRRFRKIAFKLQEEVKKKNQTGGENEIENNSK